jgi:hypothetical protein
LAVTRWSAMQVVVWTLAAALVAGVMDLGARLVAP